MLEPLGTLVFLLPVVAFIGIMTWLVLTKQMVLRIVLAMLAFLPAMAFGIIAVNRFYDYYKTWTAMYDDLSGQDGIATAPATAMGLSPASHQSMTNYIRTQAGPDGAQSGAYLDVPVTGPKSHINRHVLIFLPPQYFQKAYAHFRFPAIELLHGSPGNPSAWRNTMALQNTYTQEMRVGRNPAKPAILVMPDTNGGLPYNLQCLNQPGGLQDMTYVGKEVPDWVASPASTLRVQPPGQMWGIAGYSEGGYCAANIALQYPTRFSEAGSLSGEFKPDARSAVPAHNKPGGPMVLVTNFAHNPGLMMRNTPLQYIRHFPVGLVVPKFYLAAGRGDPVALAEMSEFQSALSSREAVTQPYTPNGGHTSLVWSAAMKWMLPLMTTDLFNLAQKHQNPPPAPAALPVKSKQAPGQQPAPAKAAPSVVNKHP